MPIYVCRACGAESRYWEPNKTCPHCGAGTFNRLTEARVKAELNALEFMCRAAKEKNQRPPTDTKRQLELFGSDK